MGLDSFWKLPKRKKKPVFEPELMLCGGMLSGHGNGSFRGKVYDHLIESVTGVSLYQEEIDDETVCLMADALDANPYDTLPEEWTDGDYGNVAADEYHDLQRMFRAFADKGATLHGGW